MRVHLMLVLSASLLYGCSEEARNASPSATESGTPKRSTAKTATAIPAAARQAYFGDLHVHTSYSYDAFVFGTRTDPDAAYEFAKGNAIKHPAGFELKLDRPLDFQAVTDHANYLGMLPSMMDADSPAYDHPVAATVREAKTVRDRQGIFAALQPYVRFIKGSDPSARKHLNMDVVRSAWSEIVAAANRHNDPGTFTAFIAYEYTSAGRGEIYNNLHRNVVFRGARAPLAPFSRLDSYNPEDLWSKMDQWRADGIDALAIPHNTNGSGGRMFEFTYFDGGVIDAAYVSKRSRNEPLVEVTQTKGTSETHPALSPNDEWANFEIMPYRVSTMILSEPAGSYVRDAFRRGLEIAAGGTENPYKFGLIGSSDTHVSGGSFDEENFWGAAGLMQETPLQRGSVPMQVESSEVDEDGNGAVAAVDDGSGRSFIPGASITNGASGLAGVWAEENTREAIFDALRRKETFATSGSRIRLRLFGGTRLAQLDLGDRDLIRKAYRDGVPMGGELTAGDAAKAPSFLVWALRDQMGAPLQRAQIIKGWLQDGKTAEMVYDVTCSDDLQVDSTTHRCPNNGARVDLDTCDISKDVGAAELKTIWTDPDFDPRRRAFYYARVLENPTCRWSTWDALRKGIAPRQDFPAVIQERAWSSPIWYTP